MKALLIKPAEQSIEPVDITGPGDIAALIGYDTVITDDVGKDGDKLHFDEECFLRGIKEKFKIDTLVPVSGVGVITGSGADGALTEPSTDIADLKARTQFL
ncbi:MAG: hypothetical protein ACPGU7_14420 [Gammaproteobacteria bacterium]